VVRGVDLLESTAAHVHLQARLGAPVLRYYHLPVVVNERQQKLSKQTGAQPIDAGEPEAAANVLELLGLRVPAELRRERPGVLWRWALDYWNIDALRGRRALAQR
jgi:glutamyl/glutaminyl-tRNA synthetase